MTALLTFEHFADASSAGNIWGALDKPSICSRFEQFMFALNTKVPRALHRQEPASLGKGIPTGVHVAELQAQSFLSALSIFHICRGVENSQSYRISISITSGFLSVVF